MVLKTISSCLLHSGVLLILGVALVMSTSSEDKRCMLPYNDPCTAATPDETRAAGLGVYYEEYPCRGAGCNFMRNRCRLCASHPSLVNRPYPECPACVPKVEGTSEKLSRDGTNACQRPEGNPCTAATPYETRAAGLGMYYEYPCSGAGCNFMGKMCRLCAIHPSKIGRPFPKCPACVV